MSTHESDGRCDPLEFVRNQTVSTPSAQLAGQKQAISFKGLQILDGPEMKRSLLDLNEAEVDSWLEDAMRAVASTTPSCDQQQSNSVATSILMICSSDLSHNVLAFMNQKLRVIGITPLDIETLGFHFQECSSFVRIEEKGILCKLRCSLFDVFWIYLTPSERIVGILHFHPRILKLYMDDFMATAWLPERGDYYGGRPMGSVQSLLRHPFTPFLAILNNLIAARHKELHDTSTRLMVIRRDTQYHGFCHWSIDELDDDSTDVRRLSIEVCGKGTRLERLRMMFRSWTLTFEYLISESRKRFSERSGQNVFEERCLHSIESSRHAELAIDSLSREVSFLSQGIFNLIAQRDQKVNIAIAHESRLLAQEAKRDSTSMKAIAGVTMLFLPGTFVASMFAMPLLQWDAVPGEQVINDRFYVYWALTVPLTVITVSVWLAFSWFMDRNQQRRCVHQNRYEQRPASSADAVPEKEDRPFYVSFPHNHFLYDRHQ